MAYLARFFQPDLIYFVTSRTVDGALFLRPSPAVNKAIGAVLADAQDRYGVEVFDFVFLSNHMHIAVRSRAGNIPAFMQYLKANVAIPSALAKRDPPVFAKRDPLAERDLDQNLVGSGAAGGRA